MMLQGSGQEAHSPAFLTVTRLTPVMASMPSLCMAFLPFFALLICLDLPLASLPSTRNHEGTLSDFQNIA
jgi:hypothetical protein